MSSASIKQRVLDFTVNAQCGAAQPVYTMAPGAAHVKLNGTPSAGCVVTTRFEDWTVSGSPVTVQMQFNP